MESSSQANFRELMPLAIAALIDPSIHESNPGATLIVSTTEATLLALAFATSPSPIDAFFRYFAVRICSSFSNHLLKS